MKKIILYTSLTVLAILLVLILRPIDTSAENSVKTTGIVQSVSQGGDKDLVITLKNDSLSYYINRGLENGFSLEKARNDLIGKKAIIFYAKYWTPLAPKGNTCIHLTHLVANDSVLYSEWK
ncbi:MAG: hypothetical protein JNJ52_07685 [Flavobacterium sp.]|nr:hypothetical protein [Flavobacterium sp.]